VKKKATSSAPAADLLVLCSERPRADAIRGVLEPPYAVQCRPLGVPLAGRLPDLVLLVAREDAEFELLESLSRRYPQTDLLVLIEGGIASLGARATAAGATAWLPLTAAPEDVCQVVDRLVERRRRAAQTAADWSRRVARLESSPIGLLELRDGRLAYVNDHLLRSLGYRREEVLGQQPADLDLVVEADRERLHAAIEQRMAGIEQSAPAVYQFKTRSGETYVAELRSRRVETPDGYVIEASVRDVTLETRLTQLQRLVIRLGAQILGESDIESILQLVLDAITQYSGFRRAVLSLYDLSVPIPMDGEVRKILTSGLTEAEREALLRQPPILPAERRLAFSERYQLGPAYYIPHDDTPWTAERGISGSVSLDGWDVNDFLFLPLRGTGGIIGSISVDDPIDRSVPTVASIEPVAALANYAALAVERVFKILQLQKRKDQLHGLSEFGVRVAHVADARTLCQLAVQHVRDMDYGVCSIYLADGARLIQEAVASDPAFSPDEVPREGARGQIGGPGATRWAFSHAAALVIPDVRDDDRFAGPGGRIRSFMAIPILGRKGPLGVVDVASDRLAAFGEQDVQVISALAAQLSAAISDLRRRDSLARIYAFGQRLAAASILDQIVTGTLDFLAEQFDFEMSSILLSSEDGGLSIAGIRGPYVDSDLRAGASFSIERGVVGWVAQHQHPLLLPDVHEDARYYEGFSGTRSELAVPVLFGGGLLGVINVESQRPAFFDDEDRQLLEAIANHLAIAMSNLASQETLREQAIRDPLTGLYNRHYFNSIISTEFSRADRYERPLSLMMLDIDGFRMVNNRFGHLRGDEVLCAVARMIERSVRASDRVIRYGGDEFLVLMPETDGRGDAKVVASRLQTRIKEVSRETQIGERAIDLSIGLYIREPRDPASLEAILDEVDRRMYAEKRRKTANGDSD